MDINLEKAFEYKEYSNDVIFFKNNNLKKQFIEKYEDYVDYNQIKYNHKIFDSFVEKSKEYIK